MRHCKGNELQAETEEGMARLKIICTNVHTTDADIINTQTKR